MNTKSLIKRCIINQDALETHPFGREEYRDTIIIRHKSNNKWFAVIFVLNGILSINLKCPPELIPILKEQYSAIKPAWHMNKKHWCMVDVNNIQKTVLDELIKISFDLTAPKRKIKKDV